MNYIKSIFLIAGLSVAMMVIQACSDDANAEQVAADVTLEEFNKLVARVAALESAAAVKPRDTLYASNATVSAKGSQKAADWADIGTRLECLPAANLFPEWCRVLTPKGFQMGLELHRDITYARHAVDVYFTLPDCMGDAYVRAVDAETGFVTAIKAGGEIPDGVYMVLPEAAAESVSVQSALSAGGASTCSNQPLNTYDAYLLVENDPETSGALSGDYGRVTHTP